MGKEVKEKKNLKRVFQSTQQNIPIKDIVEGIIITKTGEYVKIIEVKPIPFFFRSVKEQNNIYLQFSKIMKSGPYNIQIKVLSLPSDLTPQLNVLSDEMAVERKEECLKIDEEYRDRLIESQQYSITRKFYIIFSYKPVRTLTKKPDVATNIMHVNTVADTIISILKSCGNDVEIPSKNEATSFTTRALYMMFNRDEYSKYTYDEKLNDVYNKYFGKLNSTDFYLSPAEIFAPKKVAYLDSKFVVVNGMYYKFAYIPSDGYKQYLSCGWPNIFANTFVGVDVDIFIEKINKQQIMSTIRRNLSYSAVEASDASSTSESFDTANSALESGYYLKNGLNNGQEYFYINTLITVCDTDSEMVDYKMGELIKIAKANDFKLKEISFEAENAYKSVMPLCNIDKTIYSKSKRNVLTETAATVYPFTSYEINDKNGVYLGNDINSSSLVIADIFDRKKIGNSNIFICGQTGAGKTYGLLLLAIRMHIKHIPIFIIAPEKENEFKRTCNAVGGQFIEMGSGSETRINIMEIYMRDEDAEKTREKIDGYRNKTSYLAEKVDAVKSFIQLLVRDMSIEQKQLLDEAIYKTYERFGITSDNQSLWADETHTAYKKMPILSDLQDEISNSMNINPSMKSIYNTMKYFTVGSGKAFNGQTNVNLDTDFTVFGLEHLTDENMSLGIFLTMDYCWSKIKQDVTKPKALFIDEWWKMAQDELAANYSLEISKIVRAYNSAMVLATQQMSDVLSFKNGVIGEAVLNNCAIKILMKMAENDADKVQNIMLLSNNEKEQLIRNEKGSALLVYGTDKLNMKFVATKTEDKLITTNPAQLKQIAEEQEKKAQEANIRSKVAKSKNLDKYFVTYDKFAFDDDAIMLNSEDYSKLENDDVVQMYDYKTYLNERRNNKLWQI